MAIENSFNLLSSDLLKNNVAQSLQTNSINAPKPPISQTSNFQDYLTNAINEVNQDQIIAYDAMRDVALNKADNLQEAVQKIEEAELSLKLALEIQSKTLSAYTEIMRIQV